MYVSCFNVLYIQSTYLWLLWQSYQYGEALRTRSYYPDESRLVLIYRCGVVEDVYNTGKGYAFVTMADQEGADKAIAELNGVTVDGQEIKVDAAKAPREGGDRPRRNDRDGEGGGYRGGRGGGFRGGRGGGYR